MNRSFITILAKFKAKAGMEERLKQSLLAMIVPTRAEVGCLNYELHVQLNNSAVLFLYEIWENQEALDFHLQTPYFQKIQQEFIEILAEPLEALPLNRINP
jgi:quinol monooxygenase YgiN